MSHDRGCPCGREPYEYNDCTVYMCFKKEKKMDSDDWHKAHGLAEPGTKTYECKENGMDRDDLYSTIRLYAEKSNERERNMIEQKESRYVWVRDTGVAEIIVDPIAIWNSQHFDKTNDRIYKLGDEVEVKVSVEVKKKNPVYRGNSSVLFEE